MQHSNNFIELANNAKSRIKEIDIYSVQQKIVKQQNFYLIDVREPNEWQQGHLPAAIHLSKGIIERDIEKIVADYTAEIILYCGGGSRSALSADNLQKMGYKNVYSMAGGFRAWQAAAFEINK